jgi:4'-phosphopantetheinyl transferase
MPEQGASGCVEVTSMSASAYLWCSPPDHLVLGCDEVHVWRTTLDLPLSCVQSLEQTLAADERIRSQQFRFPKDRIHYIVARGILRAILGRYLASDPRTLQFHYSQHGKPSLVGESGSGALFFNITHSRRMALYAITRGREIGIDLEYIDSSMAWEEIAERFFSPYEVSMLRVAPTQMQREAFLSCWTRKEAYLKARGTGLSLALSQFDVSVAPKVSAAILSTGEEDRDISCWSLHDLSPDSGYVAALAVEGYSYHLKCWQWPGGIGYTDSLSNPPEGHL